MKISVVIPTYNRRRLLERCLSALAVQNFPVQEYEVIVVADGCTDDTVNLLSSFTLPCALRWFAQSNQGQPAAQNFGVAAATGEIVLFMDDDCVCDPNLLAAHYGAHALADNLVVIGAVHFDPDSPRGTVYELKKKWSEERFRRLSSEGICRADIMLCANSSIARQAARDCAFDTSYLRIHDIEAGVRLWKKGLRPHFAAHAIVHELFIKDADANLRDANLEGKFEVILSNSHPEFKPLAGIVIMNEGNALKRALRKQLALHPGASEVVLRPIGAVANFLRVSPLFSRIAQRILSARLVIAHLRGAVQEAGSWKALEAGFGKRVPVIMYHNVGSPRPSEYPGLTTPTVEFETQIRLLSRMGYKGIRPSDWLKWRDAGGKLPERPVMLVFDDAYADSCRNAFPILERYNFGAACMVVTRCIGSTNRWDEEAGRPSFQLMSENEMREWSEKGIEFGGHTHNHPDLRLLSDQQAEQEIAQCEDGLTSLLGTAPTSFAYPFGGFSPGALAAARRHFEIAFTTDPGILHLGTDPHLVPRISFLPGETRLGVWFRMRLGRNPVEVCLNGWARLMGALGRAGKFRGMRSSNTGTRGSTPLA